MGNSERKGKEREGPNDFEHVPDGLPKSAAVTSSSHHLFFGKRTCHDKLFTVYISFGMNGTWSEKVDLARPPTEHFLCVGSVATHGR